MIGTLRALREPLCWGLVSAIALVISSYGAALWLADLARSLP